MQSCVLRWALDNPPPQRDLTLSPFARLIFSRGPSTTSEVRAAAGGGVGCAEVLITFNNIYHSLYGRSSAYIRAGRIIALRRSINPAISAQSCRVRTHRRRRSRRETCQKWFFNVFLCAAVNLWVVAQQKQKQAGRRNEKVNLGRRLATAAWRAAALVRWENKRPSSLVQTGEWRGIKCEWQRRMKHTAKKKHKIAFKVKEFRCRLARNQTFRSFTRVNSSWNSFHNKNLNYAHAGGLAAHLCPPARASRMYAPAGRQRCISRPAAPVLAFWGFRVHSPRHPAIDFIFCDINSPFNNSKFLQLPTPRTLNYCEW